MATQYYNQPQISINDQIQLLKSEGLIINDEGKAFHLLHLVLKTAKSWSGCLVVSNKSFSFATE